MDLDSVVASPSEVKRTIVQHIEEIDCAVTALKATRVVELAKLVLIEKIEEI
jgi:hypothetical protein